MRILGGDSGASATATVVAVGAVRRMRRDGRVVRDAVVVLVRHCGEYYFFVEDEMVVIIDVSMW